MDINKKIDVWKKKLLDTGKRNKLINYKPKVSSTLEIANDNLLEIYEHLQNGASYEFASLFSVPLDIDADIKETLVEVCGKMMPKKDSYSREEIRGLMPLFKGAKAKNYLFSTSLSNLERRCLYSLKKKSNLYYEETGVNALFMVFGFLEYTDKVDNEKLFAPLCLVPVKIINNSVKDSFKISLIDDDLLLNETLLYKLKLDYKIDLSMNEEMDLKQYLSYALSLVTPLGFKVNHLMSISLFSFAKMKMYNDIEQNTTFIKQNMIVKALCMENNELNKGVKIDVDLDSLDERDLFQVLNADSSQRMAIEYAKSGLSFVLQGPPGTGKSQTITNIIGELIANNKKVLFVCEKKAALEVVYRNLEKNKLSSFALALHDPKTNKKEIIKDLCDNLYNAQNYQTILNNKAIEILDKHSFTKAKLNNYKEALHQIRKPINKSIYDIYNILVCVIDSPDIDFVVNNPTKFDNLLIEEYSSLVEALGNAQIDLLCHPSEHLFYGLKSINLNSREQIQLKNELSRLFNNLIKLKLPLAELEKLGFMKIDKLAKLGKSINFFEALEKFINLPVTYYDYKNTQEYLKKLDEIINLYARLAEIKDKIVKYFSFDIVNIDLAKSLDILKNNNGLFKNLNKEYRSLRKELRSLTKTDKLPKYKEMLVVINEALDYTNCLSAIALLDTDFKIDFNDYYFGSSTNFNELKRIISFLDLLHSTKEELDFAEYSTFINNLLQNKVILEDVIKISLDLQIIWQAIKEDLINLENYFTLAFTDENLDFLLAKLNMMTTDFQLINNYVAFKKISDNISGQMPLLCGKLLDSHIDPQSYKNAFIKRFYSLYLDEILANDEVLMNANEHILASLSKDFMQCDKLSLEIAKEQVNENVKRNWPQVNGIMGQNIEVQTLFTEANKKRKIKPLRVLFKEIPYILTKIKPVFMMSPLSVSTFIDPSEYEFDTIIFDEASQLTTENAIGSIYRAKQIIVVGDSEQLPPTNFFASNETDEEDDTYDVYESILDEALTCLPKVMLKWHYRSLDESLITFSNQEIYHSLTTFPSAIKSKELGVRYDYLAQGIYESGVRVNMVEAMHVVDLIYEHYSNNATKSLGIVTFNQSQQLLIEQLLNKRLSKDNSIENSAFNAKEPLFIKNLETVQGDERDKIILSIGFAKDKNGKLSMNFGPINQSGGYKRLNVAITRAKETLILVGSILPSEFNLAKTDSKGLTMLKDYIEYAILRCEKKENSNNLVNDEIVNRLACALEDKGLNLVRSLGESEYKIDIAIKKPMSDDYLLAIMLDGYSYARFNSSKDREHLRIEVIKSRGWHVMQMYASSLVHNFNAEVNKIMRYIETLLETPQVSNNVASTLEPLEFSVSEKVEVISFKELFLPYPNIEGVQRRILKDYKSLDGRIMEMIKALAPLKLDVLKKTMLVIYNYQKLTANVSAQMDSDLQSLFKSHKIYKLMNFVLKPSDLSHSVFRRYEEQGQMRSIDEIYIEELEDGFINVLREVKNISKVNLFDTINELLGYSKTTEKISLVYENVLNILVDKNIVAYSDDVISYLN